MSDWITSQLTEANKLIFVKQYGRAEEILKSIVMDEEGANDFLVHLRRIELSVMLGSLDSLRNEHVKVLQANSDDQTAETCMAFIDQQSESVSPKESIETFQNLMRKYSPHAACYYGIGYAMEMQENYERAIYNYEQALNIDPNWYLCYFGLSQIYYHQDDERRGDHYFFLFEKAAPYNVYGNFETHRDLCHQFTQEERYSEAELAIQTLSEWWLENKGKCPSEIQIYENLATAKVARLQGDRQLAESREVRASGLALQLVDDDLTTDGVLYFIAKVLEEFDMTEMAFRYYKAILRRESCNPAIVQKIGSQFLSNGEFEHAKELFDEAYANQPDNPDIRFCRLMAGLKMAGVNVEEYLIGRERLKQLVETSGDKVELLALLHSMMAKYEEDPEVQGHVADVYLRLGNVDRASRHYEKMFEIDGKCRSTALKYAAFLMQYRDPDDAMQVLNDLTENETVPPEDKVEVSWLRANFFARRSEFHKSTEYLKQILKLDPWNVSYIIQNVINLSHIANVDEELKKIDKLLTDINDSDEANLNWGEFDIKTEKLRQVHAYELVYARRKLRYLYSSGDEQALMALVDAAKEFDATIGTYEFMKLLNTNFDSANIYWALGTLFKSLWQLETAGMWFEQVLMYPSLEDDLRARAYLELADSYIWQNRNLNKAIEFAKLALDFGKQQDAQAIRVLAHAFLKSGQVRQARIYLEQTDGTEDHEARYLHGLLHYRNGAREDANKVWKPLLTVRSESLRFHNIKQEVLRFYFDGDPYMRAN